MSALQPLLLCVGLSYLLGSVPFGLLLTSAAGLGDIRKIGSGNIGATNVLRTGRKGLAAATLILDGAKGAAAVLVTRDLAPDWTLFAAAAAFLGHLYPVWLGFKGGKGVATALGVLLAASWPVGVLAAATWLLMAFCLRYSSLSALVAAALSPLTAWYFAGPDTALLALFLAGLIFVRHRENIARLIAGTETRIGQKKPGTTVSI
jgi:glycerol-3-phosphate acyltransferase PlsY